MTRTSNFRRVLCLLLTLLLVFTTVLRPVTVHASGALAGGLLVGVSAPVAIAGILAIIGIGVAVKNYSAIQDWVQDAIRHFFIDTDDGQAVPAYKYGNQLYIDEEIVQTAVNAYADLSSQMYSDAWDMGQKYQYMYTFKLSDNRYSLVCWTDGTPYVDDSHQTVTEDVIMIPAPALVYRYTNYESVNEIASGLVGYGDYYPYTFSGVTVQDVTRTVLSSVSDPFDNYAPGITVTADDNTKTAARPILDATTTEYVSTGTQVKVETGTSAGTDTDTVPDTGTADLSGILAWLQAIWEAIKALASNITTPIVNAISSITSWLSDIWDAIKALASDIATPIVDGISTGITSLTSWLSDIKDAISTGVITLNKSLSSVITSLQQHIVNNLLRGIALETYDLVDFITGTATVASPTEALHFSALFDLFPFNIPYGIYQAISFWEASAAPPVITIPLPTVSGGSLDLYEYEIDFSEIPGMDTIAAVIRGGELILFCIGLLLITRKVTKW